MKTKHRLSTTATLLLATVTMAYTTSCGTLLHSERSGKPHSHRIDPTIAILDGVGCLFFLVPGVIAFAVDFYTGAIYLPVNRPAGTSTTPECDPAEAVRVLQLTQEQLTKEHIEAIVSQHVGRPVTIARQTTSAHRLPEARDIRERVARFALAAR